MQTTVTAVAALDLRDVRTRVYLETKWPTSRLDAAEQGYRDFLAQDAQAEPSQDVDKFWHHHILDTAKYAQDCKDLFGFFLHHRPGPVGKKTCTKLATCTKLLATCTKQIGRTTCTKLIGAPLSALDVAAAYE